MSLVVKTANSTELEVLIKHCVSEASLWLAVADNQPLECLHRIKRPKYAAIGPRPALIEVAIPFDPIDRLGLIRANIRSDALGTNIEHVVFAGLEKLLGPLQGRQRSLLLQVVNGFLVSSLALLGLHKGDSDILVLL